jgi:broad specificity phosphatase PhoE
MNEAGIAQIKSDAEFLHKLGGLDIIFYSDLARTEQTAKLLDAALSGPGARMMCLGDRLHPWRLGRFQGQPVNDVAEQLEWYVYHPDEIVPDGESFNEFKVRYLSAFSTILSKSRGYKAGLVGNYRTVALGRAWDLAGRPKDLSLCLSAMFDTTDKTGEILYFYPDSPGLYPITHDTAGLLTNGTYMIRHGETDFNHPSGKRDPAGS